MPMPMLMLMLMLIRGRMMTLEGLREKSVHFESIQSGQKLLDGDAADEQQQESRFSSG